MPASYVVTVAGRDSLTIVKTASPRTWDAVDAMMSRRVDDAARNAIGARTRRVDGVARGAIDARR